MLLSDPRVNITALVLHKTDKASQKFEKDKTLPKNHIPYI